MQKKIILIVFSIMIAMSLISCKDSNLPLIDYEIWRDSDEAEDLNGDRKIDEEDYEIYSLIQSLSDYETWRNSDEAEDLNGDRKINEEDHELYLLRQGLSGYEIWKNSSEAEDLNGDRRINEEDYIIFLAMDEFVGSYYIYNYKYEGADFSIGNYTLLRDFGKYLNQIIIIIDNNGDVNANIPNNTISAFGEDFQYVLEGLDNMSITRISPYLIGLDTYITKEGTVFNLTLYFTENENGYSTIYTIYDGDYSATMSFELLKSK